MNDEKFWREMEQGELRQWEREDAATRQTEREWQKLEESDLLLVE